MPLVATITKLGGGVPVGMLQGNGGATTLSLVLVIKLGGEIPDGMLLADGCTDDAFGDPGHQV